MHIILFYWHDKLSSISQRSSKEYPKLIKVRRRHISGIDKIKYHTWPRTSYYMGKWQKHKTTSHTREARGQPFPQQVTTRLQGTNTIAKQWQTWNLHNKNDPPNNIVWERSINEILEGLNMFNCTNITIIIMWIKTHRCLGGMNDP